MNITQGKAVSAYRTLIRLSEQPLPLPVAHGLYRARKALENAWQFQLEQEQKMVLECKGVITENNIINFPDDAARQDYVKRTMELSKMETEVELPVVSIPAGQNLALSINDIAALDGIVAIEE